MKVICFSILLRAILNASGCVSSRPPIDLSGSIYSGPSPVADKPQLTVVEIINKAPDVEHKFQQVFASALVSISVPEKTQDTVEADLRRYFEQRTKISETANKSLRVVIHKAESYLVSPAI
ncbi:hypothetical protein [Candidatus Spongiihabitans sp.]|uniref:hypothetical protein n=1 Tax=Candidatus Spongiihabitans sp. TaxID=3101308 RepID=UPI003C6EAF34